MSEERFTGIEVKLDAHANVLDQHTAKLDAHSRILDEHTVKLDAHSRILDEHTVKLDSLTSSVEELKVGQEEMRLHLVRHDRRLDRLEIGQEAMRDEIKQVAEGHAATQALITRNFVALHALINAKVDPFLKTVQEHSAILAAHNLTLPWEER